MTRFKQVTCVLALLFTLPSIASAQQDPMSRHTRWMYAGVKTLLLRSAERMPEEKYAFRPTPAVRSFGELVGHAADWQYTYCSMVLGEPRPAVRIEKSGGSKAQLVAALKDALAYCDRAYDPMTDAAGIEVLKMHGGEMPKLGMLITNTIHSTEHYGNMVTYLRLNDIVPPSSDPGFTVPMPVR